MQPQDNPNPDQNNNLSTTTGSPPDPTPQAYAAPASGPQPLPSQVSSASSGDASSYNSSPASGGKKKKLLLGGIIAVVLLLSGSAAAYFGTVVPNKPENVWKKSLENTGKGYDKLVQYADTKKDTKGGKLNGTFKVDAGDIVADGTIESKYDEKNSDSKITLGAVGARFELNLLTNIPDGAKYPDIYAKVSGLKGLDKVLGPEAGGIGASLASFENQWYVVDHTIFDQAEKEAGSDQASELKSEDIIAFAKDIGAVTKEYVLTDDPSKAVLVRKQDVGKETMDGRSVYHYKVGINKANLKAYNKAVCDKVLGNKLYKSLSMGQSPEDLKNECYDTKDIDSLNESDTFDVYVDLKTKLIHVVRISEKDKKDNYLDIGLLYTGGDEYPFVIRGQSKGNDSDGKGELKVIINTKTNKFTITATAEGKIDNQPNKFTLNATAELSNDKVDFKKPDGAKSLLEAYGALLGDFVGDFGATPTGGAANTGLIQKCVAAEEARANNNGKPPTSAECAALFGEE